MKFNSDKDMSHKVFSLLHPEVKVGLLLLLYAGTTLLNLNYFFFDKKVKIFKFQSLSAGNKHNLILFETSETLRNNSNENFQSLSIHAPTHQRPLNEDQLGHYLAGLIDGEGHFSKIFQLVIVFNIKDLPLAYSIKNSIGFGKVKKVKNKNAYLYILTKKDGIEKVLHLINGKIKSKTKYNQIKENILKNFPDFYFSSPSFTDLNNHWLAGFSDANGSFQIKILERKNRNKKEIRLNFQIDQKDPELLKFIQSFLGGSIGYRKTNDNYYYGSTSFSSAKKVINYFDKYHLLSSKYLDSIKWRKSYILIQNKLHLTEDGIKKISLYKNSMNNFNKEYFHLE